MAAKKKVTKKKGHHIYQFFASYKDFFTFEEAEAVIKAEKIWSK